MNVPENGVSKRGDETWRSGRGPPWTYTEKGSSIGRLCKEG